MAMALSISPLSLDSVKEDTEIWMASRMLSRPASLRAADKYRRTPRIHFRADFAKYVLNAFAVFRAYRLREIVPDTFRVVWQMYRMVLIDCRSAAKYGRTGHMVFVVEVRQYMGARTCWEAKAELEWTPYTSMSSSFPLTMISSTGEKEKSLSTSE